MPIHFTTSIMNNNKRPNKGDQINKSSLAKVPHAPSKLHSYLQEDSTHERLLLGLSPNRQHVKDTLDDLEQQWAYAGTIQNSGNGTKVCLFP